MTRDDVLEIGRQADIETAHANKLMTDRERRIYWAERFAAIVEARTRKDCAQACYTRADNWKENAARAAKLCGDAIMSKVNI